MKTIKQTILGLALSVFSITAIAQCPTSMSVSIVSNLANGNLTVSQVYNVPTNTTTVVFNQYALYGATNYYSSGYGMGSSGYFTNVASGTYSLCISDSVNCGGFFSFLNNCTMVTVTNTTSPTCNAAFTQYTDSNCITHFVNNSTGTGLLYEWLDYTTGTIFSNSTNPTASLTSGIHHIGLHTYSSSFFLCDSVDQYVNITCGSGTTTPCNASFTYNTDSNCVTHFVNNSTGTGITYQWGIDSYIYTSTNINANLSNGTHYVKLYTMSSGFICDSVSQVINVSCSTSALPCNASFYAYTDSSTCLTYFVNQSTGSGLSYYEWLDYTTGTIFSYAANPTISLTNGMHHIGLHTYSSSFLLCDSVDNYINVACASGTTTPTLCQANSSFYIYADTVNVGNYFAYNFSSGSGTVSYNWNFGDGSSSTLQYPFHQYTVPGSYIVCLTVTATSGTTTCTDIYCDSSSVHRMAAGFLMSQINVMPLGTTGIKQLETLVGVNAYPNPMSDELTIEVSTKENQRLNYVLVDALGRTILTGTLNNRTTINTSGLEKGFYNLSITNEKGSSLKAVKLVK